MMNHFKPACLFLLFSFVLFGFVYPLALVGVAKIIPQDEMNVGYMPENNAGYFQMRPSNAKVTDAHILLGQASNFAPENGDLKKAVKERIAQWVKANPESKMIPLEMLFASGSGLDPHISAKSALAQVPRIAEFRHIKAAKLKSLIESHTQNPWQMAPYVDAVELNHLIDEMNEKE